MSDPVIARLTELAVADTQAASLARLHTVVAEESGEGSWPAAVSAFDAPQLAAGVPLLHERRLTVSESRAQCLLERLAAVAARCELPGANALQQALKGREIDPLDTLEASINQDERRLATIAEFGQTPAGLLAPIAGLATQPLLRACAAAAQLLLADARWPHGWCPMCAAWPALAELRGLERQRWLRCGRCGVGWPLAHNQCAYCGHWNHGTIRYLAAEDTREARRAVVCGECHGYLKTFSTLGPLSPGAVVVQDLASLDLDVATMKQEHGRPDEPAFPLRVTVAAAAARRGGWLSWAR